MQDIWGSRSETRPIGQELREEVQLHLARHLGEPHIAFQDRDGWAGGSREPGPPIDVMVIPPEGERRFAYVCTFGSSLRKASDSNPNGRMEFVLATPQCGDPRTDLGMLNIAANTVRQFAKLVHIQNIRVGAGQTVQFSRNPRPILEGSKQVAFAFMAPRLPSDGFARMRAEMQDGETDTVTFWAPVPIYRDELEAGGHHGAQRLARGLERAGVTEMLHADRPSAARAANGLRRPLTASMRAFFQRVLSRPKSL